MNAVTTEELEAVRNAMITHGGDIYAACRTAGIHPDRIPQFQRIMREKAGEASRRPLKKSHNRRRNTWPKA